MANANIEAVDSAGVTSLIHASNNGHADVSAYRLEIAFIIHHTIYFIDAL